MLIFFLLLLDTISTAFTTHGLYFYLVLHFGDTQALLSPIWSIIAQMYITCSSDVIIRCIFARRVWLITDRNYILAACIALPSIVSLGAGFAFATRAFALETFVNIASITYCLYVAFAASVTADVIIAISLCVALSRNRTGYLNTDTLLSVLISYSVNTCVLTSLCSAACLITYTLWPQDFIYLGIFFSLSKMYFNSLLAMLNARKHLSQRYSMKAPTTSASECEPARRWFTTTQGLSVHDDVGQPHGTI